MATHLICAMADNSLKTEKPEKPSATLPGLVQKVIPPVVPGDSEKAQIAVEGADHLYRELRIENKLIDEDGEKVKLKPGAEVDVTIEADPSQIVKRGA
ncbi:MAG: hypothetical protein WAU58_19615 [Terriglobales bacterium]